MMTESDIEQLGVTTDLVTAARALSIGTTTAYTAAKAAAAADLAGDHAAARAAFPCRVLKVGGRYVVPTAGLREALGLPPSAGVHAAAS